MYDKDEKAYIWVFTLFITCTFHKNILFLKVRLYTVLCCLRVKVLDPVVIVFTAEEKFAPALLEATAIILRIDRSYGI